MTILTIIKTSSNTNEYYDQTNITVTLEVSNGNIWEIQTDENGKYSQMIGCEIYVNGDNSFDVSDMKEYKMVVIGAEIIATKELESLNDE